MLRCSHLIVIVCLFIAATEQANIRIVGGNPVNIEQHPYQVSLRDRRLRHFCGGIIVTPRTILTAGHCVSDRLATNVIVVAGSTFLKPAEVTRNVKRILVHPQYNPRTFNWDAALLFVSSALSCSPSVQSIPLAINEAIVGRNASITGWGNVAEGGPASTNLRVVYVSIVARAICARNYAPTVITPIMICAGRHEGGKGACQGDSGGPVVINGEVFGIVSWGQGCARSLRPGVNANVASIRPWVMLNVI